ncbi:GNAT family N-acetyltransferase [Undibacterium amnicola]|uniref:GNAT family N-acetyltransferase n=1 Tax=Undibacterium amnicola TaxID=1834038 RepID=A0ABR6XSY9_9BURK|nr:GNAT family N-acetyltransferase [Undibacterium amnicola]MBC3832149.1 GNAT family N-acetyltransferase [Undibacterium amnicola]
MLNLISPLTARLVHANDKTFLDLLYRDSRTDLLTIPLAPVAMQQMIVMQQMSQDRGIRETYPNAQHWLLLWDREEIGRLVIDVNDFEIRLIDIAVISTWRGKGIATQVVQALQDYAIQLGRPISLAVQCNNVDALHVYRRTGFSVRSSDTLFDQMAWHPASVDKPLG